MSSSMVMLGTVFEVVAEFAEQDGGPPVAGDRGGGVVLGEGGEPGLEGPVGREEKFPGAGGCLPERERVGQSVGAGGKVVEFAIGESGEEVWREERSDGVDGRVGRAGGGATHAFPPGDELVDAEDVDGLLCGDAEATDGGSCGLADSAVGFVEVLCLCIGCLGQVPEQVSLLERVECWREERLAHRLGHVPGGGGFQEVGDCVVAEPGGVVGGAGERGEVCLFDDHGDVAVASGQGGVEPHPGDEQGGGVGDGVGAHDAGSAGGPELGCEERVECGVEGVGGERFDSGVGAGEHVSAYGCGEVTHEGDGRVGGLDGEHVAQRPREGGDGGGEPFVLFR